MADRPEDSSVAPPRTLSGPGDARRGQPQDGAPAPAPGDKRSGGQRFAAALANARGDKTDAQPRVKAKAGSGGKASDPRSEDRSTAASGSTGPRRIRKAHLRLTHVDPWSVMKTAFLLSIAIGIVMVVAVAVVWGVLGVAGVWESIDRAIGDVLGNEASSDFTVQDYVGMSRVLGFTMMVAVADVILLTVIATLAAFLYNLAAALLGGIEVTLAEDERSSGRR